MTHMLRAIYGRNSANGMADAFHVARVSKGLSMQELATKAGVNLCELVQYLRIRRTTPKWVDGVASILNLAADNWLERVPIPQKSATESVVRVLAKSGPKTPNLTSADLIKAITMPSSSEEFAEFCSSHWQESYSVLPSTEQYVVRERYLNAVTTRTWASIAVDLGVSHVRARQISQGAIRRMRNLLARERLRARAVIPDVPLVPRDDYTEDVNDETIEEMDLSIRTYNLLKRTGLNSIGQIRACSKSRLSKIRMMSKKSLDEISEKLSALGVALAEDSQ